MLTTLFVLTCVAAYAFVGSFVGTKCVQRARDLCSSRTHHVCEHEMWWIAGGFWPIAIIAGAVFVLGGSVVAAGHLAAQPRLVRKQKVQAAFDQRRENRETIRREVERRMERAAYGTRACRFCGTELERRNGDWVSLRERSCYDNPTRGSYEHVPAAELGA